MDQYIKPIDIRWSDIDANFHVRHSVYYDYGASCRVNFLEEFGLTNTLMQELHFGPILFREEAVFRKELRLGDSVKINLQLLKSRKDFSRWTIRHQIIKSETIIATVLTVDGAWINTEARKLATPPRQVVNVFEQMPKAAEFEWHGL
jgi:acyl-CoA thioester hydrolase